MDKNPLGRIYSKSLKNRETLHGCSLAGAFSLTTQIADGISIMHAPPGCGYISSCGYSNAALIEKIYDTLNYPSLNTRLMLTNIREEDVIFGGKEILQDCIKRAVSVYGWKNIFIITSCASAIIGDNIENAVSELKLNDNIDITVIDTQGVIGGDYYQGMIDVYRTIAKKYINTKIIPEKEDCLVNILNEKTMLGDADYNYLIIEKLLASFGIKVNCRYIRNTTLDEIRNFKKAAITLPYDDGFISHALVDFLREEYDIEIFGKKLPSGFYETYDWLTMAAGYFGKDKLLKKLLDKYRIRYEQIVEEQRKTLSGKSILIFSYNSNLDWIVKTIKDLGMKLEKICFVRSAENEDMPLDCDVDVEYGFNESERYSLIEKLKPDIVLAHINPVNVVEGVHYDTMPYYPKLGFFSGLELSKKWVQIFSIDFDEGWRNEKKLFGELQFKS
ncbi:MAG: nitrogenase component 1 [Actinomycetota bacterium]|nr:nitrogenase component 1 [Actinomycetota bacterium]